MSSLLLSTLLAAPPPASAALSTPAARSAATGVSAAFMALPPGMQGPVGRFLAAELSAQGLSDALAAPQAAAPAAAGVSPAAAATQTLLERLEPLSEEEAAVEAAVTLTALERVLAPHLPVERRVELAESAREVRRGLDETRRERFVRRMQEVARRLGEFPRPAALPAAGPAGRRASSLLRSRPPRLEALRDVPRAQQAQVGRRIEEAAREMYEEARIEERGGIFPLPEGMFAEILEADERTGLSQVYRDGNGEVIGFALAYVDSRSGMVHLEKLGVVREHRRSGVARRMLNALANRALVLGIPVIDLLVVKENSEAIPAYERLGFDNVTPPEVRDDPDYNAFGFAVAAARLERATRPEADRGPPAPAFVPRRRGLAGVLRAGVRRLLRRRPPPSHPSIRALFLAANPGSEAPAVLDDYHISLEELAVDWAYHESSAPGDGSAEGSAPWYAGPSLVGALREMLETLRRSGDSAAEAFVSAAARVRARVQVRNYPADILAPFRWPAPPFKGGEYWDLASGPNAAEWIRAGLDPDTHYRLFDDAAYATAFLREAVALGRANGEIAARVTVERADVRALAPPSAPLAAIRAKNVHGYVPGGAEALERMTEWIAEGGQLILQNYPQPGHRRSEIEELGPMIGRLIERGWVLERREPGPYDPEFTHVVAYTLSFTKPRADLSAPVRRERAERSQEVWDAYQMEVARMGSPSGFPEHLD